MAYSLNGLLNLQLANGALRGVTQQIQAGLRNVSVAVDIRLSPSAAASLNALQQQFEAVNRGAGRTSAVAAQVSAAYGSLGQASSRLASEQASVAAALSGTVSQMNKVQRAAVDGSGAVEQFGHQVRLAGQRFSAFVVAVSAFHSVMSGFRSSISDAIAFDREMVRLSQVSDDTKTQVAAVGQEVTRLSVAFGVNSRQLLDTAVVFKQAGLSINDTKDALEAMAKASLAPNFGTMNETAETAIAIMSQFKVKAGELEGALGSVNAVASAFAVEAKDLSDAIRSTGGVFKTAGGSLNELLALFTSIRATTRQSSEQIATGLSTILSRLQRPKTLDQLRELGVELRRTRDEARAAGDLGLEGQFVGPYEAIKRISAALSELRSSDPRFAAVAESLGGYRQISRVIPLLQEQALAQQALNVAQHGSGSLTRDAAKAQDALAVQLQKVHSEFLKLGRDIVNSEGFRGMAKDALSLASGLIKIADALRPLLPAITAFAAVKLTQNIGSFVGGLSRTPVAGAVIPKFHKGGDVPGHGEMLAVLEGGEHVIDRRKAAHLRRQHFADGGYAQINFPSGVNSVSLLNLQDRGSRGRLNVVVDKASIGRKTDAGEVFESGYTRQEEQSFREAIKKRVSGKTAADLEPEFKTVSNPQDVSVVRNKKTGAYFRRVHSSPGNLAVKRAFDRFQQERSNALLATNFQGVSVPVNIAPIAGDYRQKVEGVFEKELHSSVVRTVNEVVKTAVPSKKQFNVDNAQVAKAIDIVFANNGRGRFFEAVLQSMRSKSPEQHGAAFDLPAPQDDIIQQMFGISKSTVADVKLANSEASVKDMAQKAVRYFGLKYSGERGRFETKSLDEIASSKTREVAHFAFGDKVKQYGKNLFKAYYAPFVGAQSFAGLIEKEKGLSDEQIAKLKKKLFAGDYLGSKLAAAAASPFIGSTAAALNFVPVASLGHIAYNTVRHPSAVGRAASGVAAGASGLLSQYSEPILNFLGGAGTHLFADGGTVPAMVMPGELIFSPGQARKIGYGRLRRANENGDMGTAHFAHGGVAVVPGYGDTDSVPVDLQPGSFVIKKRSAQKLLGRAKMAHGNTLGNVPGEFTGNLSQIREVISSHAKQLGLSFSAEEALYQDFLKQLQEANARRLLATRQAASLEEANAKSLAAVHEDQFAGKDSHRVRLSGESVTYAGSITGESLPYYGFAPESRQAGRRLPQYDQDIYGLLPIGDDNAAELERYTDKAAQERQRRLHAALDAGTLSRPDTRERFTSTTADAEVGGRVSGSLARFNGIVSQRTLDETSRTEAASVQQEFIRTQSRLNQALHKQLDALEAQRLAEEQWANALKEGTDAVKLVRTKSGHLVTEASADAARGKNLNVDDLISKGGFREKLRGLGGIARRATPYAAAAGAAYGAEFIADWAGSPAAAVSEGGETRAKYGTAISGGLQSAQTGAIIGSAIPGVGTALGAGIGAIYGFSTSLKQAEKEIREAKLGAALGEVSTKLQDFASLKLEDQRGRSTSEFSQRINQIQSSNFDKARKESTHFFSGFDEKQFSELTKKYSQENLGRIAPTVTTLLTQRAADIGKRNPSAGTPADFERLQQQLLEGGNGFNRKLLEVIASFHNESIADATKRFAQTLQDASRDERLRKQGDKVDLSTGRSTTSLLRLAESIEAAVAAMATLQQRSDSLAASFDGRITATKPLDLTTPFHQIGGPDRAAFQTSLRSVVGQLGPQGAQTARTTTALDDVARALPDAISQAFAHGGGLDSSTLASKVGPLVAKAISGQSDVSKLNREQKTVLDRALHNLEGQDITKLRKDVEVDPAKFVEQTLLGNFKSIPESLAKMSKDFGDQMSRLVDGFTADQQRRQAINHEKDQFDVNQLASRRNAAGDLARSAGFGSDPAWFLSLRDELRPITNRQERLSGETGRNAFDPELISRKLSAAMDNIEKATERQNEAQRAGNNGEIVKTAAELARLKGEANNLQNALRRLANASERNAVIQERLQQLNNERQARVSFGARVLSAGPQELAQINRAFALTRVANRQGNLNGFLPQDAKAVIDLLQSLGHARLRGPEFGGVQAKELHDNLIKHSGLPGLFDLPEDARGHESDLRSQLAESFKVAETAQARLIGQQERLQTKLFSGLEKENKSFITELKKYFAGLNLATKQSESQAKSVTTGDLKKLDKAKIRLASLGVADDKQLAFLQQAVTDGSVANYASALTKRQRIINASKERITTASLGNSNEVNSSQRQSIDDIIKRQTGVGIDPKDLNNIKNTSVARIQNERVKYRFFGTYIGDVSNQRKGSILQEEIDKHKKRELEALDKQIEEGRKKFGGYKGDKGRLETELAKGDKSTLISDIQSFSTAHTTFSKLASDLKTAEDAFKKVTDEVERLKKVADSFSTKEKDKKDALGAAGGPVAERAAGGSIFKSRGSDTVPAMLTPGEFVVNAASAKANKRLLEHINAGRGRAAYFADGGEVDKNHQERVQKAKQFLQRVGYGLPESKKDAASKPATLSQLADLLKTASDADVDHLYQKGRSLQSYFVRSQANSFRGFAGVRGVRNREQLVEMRKQLIDALAHDFPEKGLNRAQEIEAIGHFASPVQSRIAAEMQKRVVDFASYEKMSPISLKRLYARQVMPSLIHWKRQSTVMLSRVEKAIQKKPSEYLQDYANKLHVFIASIDKKLKYGNPDVLNKLNLTEGSPEREAFLEAIKEAHRGFVPPVLRNGAIIDKLKAENNKQADAVSKEAAAYEERLRRKAEANPTPRNVKAWQDFKNRKQIANDAINELRKRGEQIQGPGKPPKIGVPFLDSLIGAAYSALPSLKKRLPGAATTSPPKPEGAAVKPSPVSPAEAGAPKAAARPKAAPTARARPEPGRVLPNKAAPTRPIRRRRVGSFTLITPNGSMHFDGGDKPHRVTLDEVRRQREIQNGPRNAAGTAAVTKPSPPLPAANDANASLQAELSNIDKEIASWQNQKWDTPHEKKALRNILLDLYVKRRKIERRLQASPPIGQEQSGAVGGETYASPLPKFAAGGVIPGNDHQDKTLILASSGEAILNRRATEKLGASGVAALNKFASGGIVGGGSAASVAAPAGNSAFIAAATKLESAFSGFAVNAEKLSKAVSTLNNLKMDVHVQQKLEVILNGAEVLSKLEPQIKEMVIKQTQDMIAKTFKKHLPDAGQVTF